MYMKCWFMKYLAVDFRRQNNRPQKLIIMKVLHNGSNLNSFLRLNYLPRATEAAQLAYGVKVRYVYTHFLVALIC